ncbi:MAG: lysophospholipid acyltransferase family protein [Candidatus Competibacteraceae bacterium]|nr:lysophospholipid acyltransferase family protein [Candidatus Competibacteraceae bacterium]
MSRRDLVIRLLRFSAWFPLPVVHAIGTFIGWLLSWIPNKPQRIAAANIARCLPEWSPTERDRLLRRNLAETGKVALELGPLWLWDKQQVLGMIQSVTGEDAWKTALAQGRGGIAITPHLGAWEVAGLYVSSRYPTTILYRPSRLGIDELICTGRERAGGRTVPTDSTGVRALYKALQAAEVLGILPDQDPDREAGIFAPFFGQPAHTMVLLSRLAIKYHCPVCLVFAERLPKGQGYRLRFDLLPSIVSEGTLEASVTAVNAAVEQAVRRRPEQYLWAYKRFKTQPRQV